MLINKQITGSKPIKIGLIINPFAGLGGEAALKGSDGESIRQQALEYHENSLKSPSRAERFLFEINRLLCKPNSSVTSEQRPFQWYCLSGDLGETPLIQQGIKPIVSAHKHSHTHEDTLHAVQYFLQEQTDLIVFVGGDGTARDVLDGVGDENTRIMCLGVPAGVKMQSAVFAITPESAAQIIAQWCHGELNTVALQDVRDIDEEALRNHKIRSKYYGAMHTLSSPQFLQRLKQSGIEQDDLVLDDIADHLDELLEEGHTLLVGPGSTTAYFMQRNGFTNTLVGFDAVNREGVLSNDLTGKQCLDLFNQHKKLKLVITPTGQQGFLLGRGNQQLNEAFLSQLPKEQMCIISTKSKLNDIAAGCLQIDTANIALNKKLSGFYPIVTAYQETVIYPVGNV